MTHVSYSRIIRCWEKFRSGSHISAETVKPFGQVTASISF